MERAWNVAVKLAVALAAVGGLTACESSDDYEVTALDAGDHERFFPIRSGPHAVDCNECHGRFDTFQEFACLDCHEHAQAGTDPIHRGMSDYRYESTACYACHPRGTADGSNLEHGIFPIGDGSAHADAACMECHLSTDDRSQIDCATCHADADTTPAHTAVGGYVHGNPGCVRCHADSQVHPVATHTPFLIDATAPHFQSACLECHPGMRTDKPFGADFASRNCLQGCHEQGPTGTAHQAVADYAYETPRCLACHPDGNAATSVNHGAFFPIGPGSAHAATTCAECHTDAANRQVVTCNVCHAAAETTPDHAAVGGFVQTNDGCLRCHADAQVNAVASHGPFLIGAGAPHFQSSCLACHPSMRTDKPFGADFASQACLQGCHAQGPTDTAHQGIAGYGYATAQCQLCHPDGSASSSVDHSPFFPIGAGTVHATTACADCHTDATNRRVVTCNVCHAAAETTPTHGLVGGFVQTNAGCLRCHADSQVHRVASHGTFRITSGAPHFRSSCLECHPAMRTDKPFGADFRVEDCLGCHGRSETDADHQGESGYSYSTPRCLACHPDGRG